MNGVYVILVQLAAPVEIHTKGKKQFVLQTGFYAYVGSALGGIEQRVARHLRQDKKRHWHIDYLLECGTVEIVICSETNLNLECALAQSLSWNLSAVSGFGCSDCRCHSHLFSCKDVMVLERLALSSLCKLGLRPAELISASLFSLRQS